MNSPIQGSQSSPFFRGTLVIPSHTKNLENLGLSGRTLLSIGDLFIIKDLEEKGADLLLDQENPEEHLKLELTGRWPHAAQQSLGIKTYIPKAEVTVLRIQTEARKLLDRLKQKVGP